MFYVWSKWLNITFYNSLDIDNQMLQNDKNNKIKSSRCTMWGISTLEMFTQSPTSAKEWDISRKDISFYSKQHAQIY